MSNYISGGFGEYLGAAEDGLIPTTISGALTPAFQRPASTLLRAASAGPQKRKALAAEITLLKKRAARGDLRAKASLARAQAELARVQAEIAHARQAAPAGVRVTVTPRRAGVVQAVAASAVTDPTTRVLIGLDPQLIARAEAEIDKTRRSRLTPQMTQIVNQLRQLGILQADRAVRRAWYVFLLRHMVRARGDQRTFLRIVAAALES